MRGGLAVLGLVGARGGVSIADKTADP
jgi:hypothetical protein